MSDARRRIDPVTDRATAALILGCWPDQVGYCARCQGLTVRYGSNAQVICPACRASGQDAGTPSG